MPEGGIPGLIILKVQAEEVPILKVSEISVVPVAAIMEPRG